MGNLGDVVVSRKAGLGAILGFAAIGLPAAGLCLFMIANVEWSNPTKDDLMGIGTVGVFALIGCSGLFTSIRLRFDICENGIRARKLFSSLELPFSELKTISVERTTSNQTDLLSGKSDLGYSVVVWNEAGASADFESGGFGSDAEVESAIEKMQGLIANKLRAKLDAGRAVDWMPGVTIDAQRVKGQLQRSVFTTPILDFVSQPMELRLDDPNVTLSLQRGKVTLFSGQSRVAYFGCDAPNYFPGEKLLRERAAWQFTA